MKTDNDHGTTGNVRAELARARMTGRAASTAAGIGYSRWQRRMRTADDWTVAELRAIARVLDVPLARLTGNGA